jgi:hypothetical protein
LIASLNEGEARGRGKTAGGGTVDSAGEELEVGGDTDRWGRPGSEWEREEGELGRAGFVGRKKRGRRGLDGPREEGKRKKEKERWAGPRVEVRWVGFVFSFSFSNPFQTNFKPF